MCITFISSTSNPKQPAMGSIKGRGWQQHISRRESESGENYNKNVMNSVIRCLRVYWCGQVRQWSADLLSIMDIVQNYDQMEIEHPSRSIKGRGWQQCSSQSECDTFIYGLSLSFCATMLTLPQSIPFLLRLPGCSHRRNNFWSSCWVHKKLICKSSS